MKEFIILFHLITSMSIYPAEYKCQLEQSQRQKKYQFPVIVPPSYAGSKDQ